jgi:outer membrane autotransporter protein
VAALALGGGRHAWGRVLSYDIGLRQGGTVSPRSDGRLNGFQAGTDLLVNSGLRAGAYVGQLDGSVDVSGFARGVADLPVGSSDLRNQYLAVYATHEGESGLYVDGVLQAGRHRYTLEPANAPRVSGKGRSLLASVEVGRSFALGDAWSIEPQLQLIYQRLKLDDLAIAGALVHHAPDHGWLTRAGVRVKTDLSTRLGELQPYGRVNVYHGFGGSDVTRFDGPAGSADILTAKGYTSAELAAGLTLSLGPVTSLYGEVGKLWDIGGDARVRSVLHASLGVRVRW